MNKIPNRAAICAVLMAHARTDPDIVALCSDSRGSASMTPFFEAYPSQSVEVGIAEQNLVGIAAGLAKCGKKAFCFSPACFLSTRSYEQAKIDVAYSNTNVKLIGISGGISYGELGMSHHSAQDIAAMSAIPNMRVYLPSDRHQTARLMEALLEDQQGAYVRVGRNPVEDIYSEENCPFELNHAVRTVFEPQVPENSTEKQGDAVTNTDAKATVNTVTLVACGEMVCPALKAGKQLARENIRVIVLDMYCVKPLDRQAILDAAKVSDLMITIEEHAPYGGLGSMVASVVSANCPRKVLQMALPDAHVITGKSPEVFAYYGLNEAGIYNMVKKELS